VNIKKQTWEQKDRLLKKRARTYLEHCNLAQDYEGILDQCCPLTIITKSVALFPGRNKTAFAFQSIQLVYAGFVSFPFCSFD